MEKTIIKESQVESLAYRLIKAMKAIGIVTDLEDGLALAGNRYDDLAVDLDYMLTDFLRKHGVEAVR